MHRQITDNSQVNSNNRFRRQDPSTYRHMLCLIGHVGTRILTIGCFHDKLTDALTLIKCMLKLIRFVFTRRCLSDN